MSKQLLHVGCGALDARHTPFRGLGYHETRVDLDPRVKPDIVASMVDLSEIRTESAGAVYSSHNLEHLYSHEVGTALREFYRVLNMDGLLVLVCPDLQSVAELVALDKLTETAYISKAGPITPLDMIFGLRSDLRKGNHFMAHRCGFTASTLVASIKEAGFKQVLCRRRGADKFDLTAIATKTECRIEELQDWARKLFRD